MYGPTSVPAKAARTLERFPNAGCSFSRFGNGEGGRLLEKLKKDTAKAVKKGWAQKAKGWCRELGEKVVGCIVSLLVLAVI